MDVTIARRSVRSAARAAWIMLCLAALAAPAKSQVFLKGQLYNDATGQAVRGTMMLVDPSSDAPVAHVITDSTGNFELRAHAGTYQLAAVRDGFTSTLSAPLALRDGERMTLRVPIARDGYPAHRIGVLEHVQPESKETALADAEDHGAFFSQYKTRWASAAPGFRYTTADFDRSGVNTLGEFLQSTPGVSVSNTASAASVDMSRSLATVTGGANGVVPSCHVGWFLDGHRMDYGPTIDPSTDALGLMQLGEIEAVEVFRGLSEMPAEFASPELRCGAIAIWTRRQ